MVLLAGCSSSPNTAANSTPTPTATPTPSPTPANPCTQLAGFQGASPQVPVPSFTDVPFPAGTLGANLTSYGGTTGLFAVKEFDACASGTSATAVRSFYASQLPAHGWAQAATYPYDGQYQASCGDPYCWSKDGAPRYVSLEKVTDHPGGAVTFHLRLGLPPGAPKCPTSPFGQPPYKLTYTFANQNTDVPLPPLSLIGPGDGSGGLFNNSICSAGDAASINNFYLTELPKLGFHQGTLPASDDCGSAKPWSAWVKGNEGVIWTVNPGTAYNPGWGWNIQYCS